MRKKKEKKDRPYWGLIRTKTNQEMFAARNIRERGGEYWLPIYWDERVKQRRALFPTYVFVKIDPGTGWIYLTRTRGVKEVLLSGEHPSRVPDHVMKELMKRQDKVSGLIKMPKFEPEQGEKIKIAYGPFQNVEGVYIAPTGPARCRILLSLMGREWEAEMDQKAIKPAKE